MCLHSVNKRFKKPSPLKVVVAYKRVNVACWPHGRRSGWYIPAICSGREMKLGKWYSSGRLGQIQSYLGPSYPKGFHAFRFKRDAEAFGSPGIVVQVHLRGVHTAGPQGQSWRYTYVAKWQKIVKEIPFP